MNKRPEPNNFSTDSWNTIVSAVKSNNISKYNVGDTKEVDMGDLGTHTLRIANTTTPSECSTEGFSQTACGFVLEFADIVTTHRMNPYSNGSTNGDGNKGGWQYSEARTYINNDIYNSLPLGLKNGIIDTVAISGHGANDSSNFTTTDKLYLLSAREVGSSNSDFDSGWNFTRQLDYYNLNGVTSSYDSVAPAKKTDSDWWLRNARSTNIAGFYIVSSGYCDSFGSDNTAGISPAFRIG